MKIRCFHCGAFYTPHITNSRMIGPNLVTTCPFCNKEYERKLNKFVELQLDPEMEMPQMKRAMAMIRMAQVVEKAAMDEVRKNKKKNNEKNSNVRNRGTDKV